MLMTYLLWALKGLRCDGMRAQGEGGAGAEAETSRGKHQRGWGQPRVRPEHGLEEEVPG